MLTKLTKTHINIVADLIRSILFIGSIIAIKNYALNVKWLYNILLIYASCETAILLCFVMVMLVVLTNRESIGNYFFRNDAIRKMFKGSIFNLSFIMGMICVLANSIMSFVYMKSLYAGYVFITLALCICLMNIIVRVAYQDFVIAINIWKNSGAQTWEEKVKFTESVIQLKKIEGTVLENYESESSSE